MLSSVPVSDRHQDYVKHVVPVIPYLKNFAYQLTHDHDKSQDLLQDTLVASYRFWNKFDQGKESHVRWWLTKIMKNQFLNDYRKQKRLNSQAVTISYSAEGNEYLLERIIHAPEEDESPDVTADSFADEMKTALSRLDTNYRQILIMSDVEELCHTDISQELGIPVGTVKSRIHRARKALKSQLYEYGRSIGYDVSGLRMEKGFRVKSRTRLAA